MLDDKVSIDPGKNGCGVAVWRDLRGKFVLAWSAYVKNISGQFQRAQVWGNMAREVYAAIDSVTGAFSLILEIPQVYSGVREEDPNDLIDLAGVQGAIIGCTGKRVDWSPLPREWKGQLPKAISEKRVESKLNDAEKKLVVWPAKSLKHNVYDALHLGLVYLERQGLRDVGR